MSRRFTKILVPCILTVFLVTTASSTDLQNILSITSDGSKPIYVNDSLNLNSNDLHNPNLVDGVNLDLPGNALNLSSNQYNVEPDSISTSELNTGDVDTRYLNKNGDKMNGSLNMGNNDINNIGGLQSCGSDQYVGGDGSCKNDDGGTDDQNLGYNNKNSPTGNYVKHEVTITGGSNTDIRDYYESDTTADEYGNWDWFMDGVEQKSVSSGQDAGIDSGNAISLSYNNGRDIQVGVSASDLAGSELTENSGAIDVNLKSLSAGSYLSGSDYDGSGSVTFDVSDSWVDEGSGDVSGKAIIWSGSELQIDTQDSTLTTGSNGIDIGDWSDAGDLGSNGDILDDNVENAELVNTGITVSGGTDISGGSADLGNSLTVDHADTSTQSNVASNGATVIDDINVDGRGHVTNMNTENREVSDWAAASSNVDMNSNNVVINGAGGNDYDIGPGSNSAEGVSVRANTNPTNNIFSVESSGSATRFGVQQGGGTWSKDGFFIGQYDSSSASSNANYYIDGSGNVKANQLQADSTPCNSDQYIGGDGGCKDDDTGSDDQNLGYNNKNSPTSNYKTHEITITGGSNTDIRDYYDPDTTADEYGSWDFYTDNTNRKSVSSGQDIGIDSGNAINLNWDGSRDVSVAVSASGLDGSYLSSSGGELDVDSGSVLGSGNDLDSSGDVSGLTDVTTSDLSEGSNEYHTDGRVHGAVESGNVDNVQFSNIESVSNGEIGRDNSIGFLAEWGGNGNAVLWDAYNVQTNGGISVTGGTGNEDNPKINLAANDLDASGNINDWSGADDLDGSGDVNSGAAGSYLSESSGSLDVNAGSVLGSGNDLDSSGNVNHGIGASLGDGRDAGSDYVTFANSGDFYIGGSSTPDASTSGIHVEANSNPSSGNPIFTVESSGGSERLRVEHGGDLYTSNNLDVDGGNIYDSGSNFFGGCSSGDYVESINSDGSVNCANDDSGGTSLTGGDGINPSSISNGNTLSVAWSDASELDAGGKVDPSGIDGGFLNADGGNLSFGGIFVRGNTSTDLSDDIGFVDYHEGTGIKGIIEEDIVSTQGTSKNFDRVTPSIDFRDFNDVSSGGNVDWGSASDLDSNGDISSFDNANDLDSSGNVDWSGASDLDSNGDISSFDDANDLDSSGNVDWSGASDLDSNGDLNAYNFANQGSAPQNEIITGDANGDGVINKEDIQIIQNEAVGFTPDCGSNRIARCDINGDGSVQSDDIQLLARFLNGDEDHSSTDIPAEGHIIRDTDNKVSVDLDSTPDTIGKTGNSGVIQTDSTMTYNDKGDSVELGVSSVDTGQTDYKARKFSAGISSSTSSTFTSTFDDPIDKNSLGTPTTIKVRGTQTNNNGNIYYCEFLAKDPASGITNHYVEVLNSGSSNSCGTSPGSAGMNVYFSGGDIYLENNNLNTFEYTLTVER